VVAVHSERSDLRFRVATLARAAIIEVIEISESGISEHARARAHTHTHTHTYTYIHIRQRSSINDNVDRAAERVRLPTREHATRRAEHARFRNARRMPRAQLRRCSSTSGFQRTETASETGGSWLLLGKRQKVADFPNPNDGGEAGRRGSRNSVIPNGIREAGVGGRP